MHNKRITWMELVTIYLKYLNIYVDLRISLVMLITFEWGITDDVSKTRSFYSFEYEMYGSTAWWFLSNYSQRRWRYEEKKREREVKFFQVKKCMEREGKMLIGRGRVRIVRSKRWNNLMWILLLRWPYWLMSVESLF